MPVDLTWHHQWVHPPFPYTSRTAPETGEQFSMPICSVLSCPGIAGNFFMKIIHINQAVATIFSGFYYESCLCSRSILNFRCLMSWYPDSVYPIFGLHVSRIYSVLTNVKDVKRKMGDWQQSWKWHLLTLVGLALITRLVSDIWSDLFGRFCDFNLGLFVDF